MASVHDKPLAIEDLKQVRGLLYDVRAKWYDIGIELGVPTGTLDSIKLASHTPDECLREMLKAWLNTLTPTVQGLTTALKSKAVGELKLAEQVLKQTVESVPKELETGAVKLNDPSWNKLAIDPMPSGKLNNSSASVQQKSGRFPFLVTKHLKEEQRLRLEGRLGLESENLQDKFVVLVSNTAQALQKDQVDVEQLKIFLSGYAVPVNTNDDSVARVMLTARESWHFLNYRILKNVINEFGSEENKKKLETYDSEFKEYCGRRLYEVPIDMLLHGSNEDTVTEVCFKTDKYFDFPLKDFYILENRISEILETRVILKDVDKGCVQLTYNCLKTSDELFPLSTYQKEQLKKEGVVMLYSTHCEYHFSSPFESEWRELQSQMDEMQQTIQAKDEIIQAKDREVRDLNVINKHLIEQNEEMKQIIQAKENELIEFQQSLKSEGNADSFLSLQDVRGGDLWNIPRAEVEMIPKEQIGLGAWGAVYSGKYRGEEVAIKHAHKLLLQDVFTVEIIKKFKREILIMAHIQHPNLVRFVGAVLDEAVERGQDAPIILSELLDMNLRDAYSREDLGSNLVSIFRDVAYALHYLHQHRQPIIHRNVSASNVLLQSLPNKLYRAKVSGLGSANLVSQSRTPVVGAIIYSSPEMFPPTDVTTPPPPQTTKVDVFSYGVLLLEVILKELPVPEKRPAMLLTIKEQWNAMHELIIHCTKHSPSDRPTMADILNKLHCILHGL